MISRLLCGALLVAAPVLVFACAPYPPNTPVDVCGVRTVLVVRNQSGGDIEIVESRRGSGGRTVIAIVGPGTSEVRIHSEPEYVYSARHVGGRTIITATSRSRVRDHAVTMSRECRN